MSAFRDSKCRVFLFGEGTGFGPGTVKAIIDNPKYVGVAASANAAGEFFMTLPYNHPNAAAIVPLQTHYRVTRWNEETGAYDTVGRGIVDDYQATENEVVVYGSDYMSLLDGTITSSTTSYSNTALGTIVTAQISAAINESNSRLAFTSLGTIEATTVTATLISAYESRLSFISGVADVSMADRSVRTLLKMDRDTSTWSFTENAGQDRPNIRLEWGGLVNSFVYLPSFRDFATRINAVGVKREGATVLYSEQAYASEATYGHIARPAVFQNVVDQTALNRLALREARRRGRPAKNLQMRLRSGRLIPWNGWDIGDSVFVQLQRGVLVNVAELYTVWGMRWTLDTTGQEVLDLDLVQKAV